jgi:hypothetical protein
MANSEPLWKQLGMTEEQKEEIGQSFDRFKQHVVEGNGTEAKEEEKKLTELVQKYFGFDFEAFKKYVDADTVINYTPESDRVKGEGNEHSEPIVWEERR